MSKRQWLVLLCIFIIYILVGAAIFLYVERQEEAIVKLRKMKEKKDIEELLRQYDAEDKKELFQKLSNYCGKPLSINMSEFPEETKWDFYNAVFFVITVVSTIGYGNLSPTTTFTRIFMIFYGLIGIPINGILMVTLGEYFGTSFKKLYHRWKNSKLEQDTARMGLIGQIILYLIPGFTFFIFLPSTIMTVFENWSYDEAVYYCFVSLTTIGFGDYVSGTTDVANFGVYYSIYKFFIFVWLIGGLGYVVMVLNFIGQGLRSKRIMQIEHVISENIKNTPKKIRQELRTILQEFLFSKIKPIYKDEFEYVPNAIEKSESCPDLTIYRSKDSPSLRRRAMSDCYRHVALQRIQSDTDLEHIDKERTFKPSEAFMQQKDLLLKVVDALSYRSLESMNEEGGINCFSDEDILASEGPTSHHNARRRAVSDVVPPKLAEEDDPNRNTWYGNDAKRALQQLKKKRRTLSIPESIKAEKSIWDKFKDKFRSKDCKNIDLEKQEIDRECRRPSMLTSERRPSTLSNRQQEQILEETSIADFIRALTTITVPEVVSAEKENIPSPRSRRTAIRANFHDRRPSLIPSVGCHRRDRRLSLRQLEESGNNPNWIRKMSLFPATIREQDSRRSSLKSVPPPIYPGGRRFSLKNEESVPSRSQASSPPPYSLLPPEARNIVRTMPQRKFSVNPANLAGVSGNSPVQRQVQKKERTDTESGGDKQQ